MKVSIQSFYFYLILGKIILALCLHSASGYSYNYSGNASFIINFCDVKFWLCAGAYIKSNWVVATAACAYFAKISLRVVAVAGLQKVSCQHGEKRQIHSVELYPLQYNLDTEIGLIEIEEPFELKTGTYYIPLSDEVPLVEECIIYGTWMSDKRSEDGTIEPFVSFVLPTDYCVQYYDIDDPEYFICLSRLVGAEVWNYPVVCADKLEAFVVADDGIIIIAMRVIIYLDWITNITGPIEHFRALLSENNEVELSVNNVYLALCTLLFSLYYL